MQPTTACGLPLFSQRLTDGSRRQRNIIFLCQHFGTGVLLATAFVHLLPTAFTSLTDPCLPYAFSEGYTPLAGLIAMVSALVVVALESYLTTRGASHSHSHHVWGNEDDGDSDGVEMSDTQAGGGSSGRRGRRDRPDSMRLDDMEAEGLVSGASPLPGTSPMPGATPTMPPPREGLLATREEGEGGKQGEDERESLDLELSFDELRPAANGGSSLRRQDKPEPGTPGLARIPSPEEQKRMMLQCVLLEAGILFHSVFIGMALSVATGPTFAVFLIAISFHRTYCTYLLALCQ